MSPSKAALAVLSALALTGAASAQPTLPPNSLSCAGFTRTPVGTWAASSATAPFDFGSARGVVIRNTTVTPNGVSVSGFDLYKALEAKCGH
jgi:hypothetical protein